MSLKRKRSTSISADSAQNTTLSSPSSTTSTTSFSPSHLSTFYTQSKPLSPFPAHPSESSKSRLSATDLTSRTQKRYRDNRPPESIIHAETMRKLFSAQRQPHLSPPATPGESMQGDGMDWGQESEVAGDVEEMVVDVQEGGERGQRSLEAFWGRTDGR
ncbi:hypothetical protein C1H76_0651 [Elsinoe australis]|uniref:Uncharacterized protein n=1 Tax=Elsinoe australis TaxID=40998 RepID=A0A4U7BEQ3_9PEZI|nr:hypothetical protein C1H76_0651 [Elsinoe australis]